MNQFIFYSAIVIAVVNWLFSYRNRARREYDLKRTLYNYKMRIDFMNAIIVHNSEMGVLADIPPDTIRRMRLTPAHFKYFKFSHWFIDRIFPGYDKKIDPLTERTIKLNQELREENDFIRERNEKLHAENVSLYLIKEHPVLHEYIEKIRGLLGSNYSVKVQPALTSDYINVVCLIKEGCKGLEEKDEPDFIADIRKIFGNYFMNFSKLSKMNNTGYNILLKSTVTKPEDGEDTPE